MKRKRSKKKQKSQNKENPNANDNGSYEPINKNNSDFEDYYKSQGIVRAEEWESFMHALRRELPCSFRITGFHDDVKELKHCLETEYFNELENIEIEGQKIESPKNISWYPGNIAFSYEASRRVVRRCSEFSRFHNFLVSETELGNICRQEIVSMIPPLFMDIRSDHYVLDMCAAPGSKTSQLIDMMHCGNKTLLPSGVVIANDSDQSRAYTLVHQVKKLGSPCLIVTNHDATMFPPLNIINSEGHMMKLQFDRILADVPCSGDGTMRKNPLIWKKWNGSQGNALHSTQIKILTRAVQLLKVGGRIVYSTCSFNPIENEAVVAHILREYQGSVHLLDVSDKYPDLIHSKGLNSWKVWNSKEKSWASVDQLSSSIKYLTSSMFSPSDDEVAKFNLERCLRILPHHQDTGGFFIAVLEKTSAVSKAEVSSKVAHFSGNKEDPFTSVSKDSELIQEIRKSYLVDDIFPWNNLMTRSSNDSNLKMLYFVSDGIKNIFSASNNNLKIINTGIVAFGRNNITKKSMERRKEEVHYCNFRIHNEIIPYLHPCLQSRLITFTVDDLIVSLSTEYPKFTCFSPKVISALESMTEGGFLFKLDSSEQPFCSEKYNLKANRDIFLSGWRAMCSISIFLSAKERKSLLTRLLGADKTEKLLSANEPLNE